MATFMERLAFLQKVPTLMKATADDENPCPGYLFQEIGKISHESSGCGQCLLEYLLERLQVESCHVKLKVLKIFVHLCGHGSNHFLTELRRNSTFIQQASVYSGPPDPIHGTALYEKVRNTAQVRHGLFYVYKLRFSSCVFTSPVTKWCPGQVGGGWEETDSGNSSSHNSSQDIAANSRASVGSKSAGTGSQSGASRESSGDLSDRVEALQLGDCGQEMALINKLTEGSKVFLSREESQHFIKECSILNCEVVVELLSCKLQDPSYTIKMRALCAVASLMTSDLLSLEQMFGATQHRLRQLSEGPPGPVANKATKILRQFEALMGGSLHATRQDAVNSHQATVNQLHTSSSNLLPTHLFDSFKLQQPDTSSAGVIQPPKHPSPPPSQDLAQSHELAEDQVQPVRTGEVRLHAEDSETVQDKSTLASCEPQSKPHPQSRLSLFSGMELVTKGKPLCNSETSHEEVEDKIGDRIKEMDAVHKSDCSVNSSITSKTSEDVPSVCSSSASNCSQSVSAFSFLNF
uniref:ENTH domain-containing protein n=1 Tax=Astatotilapia calliptera TaxID=8154 RepID=A0AAX7T1X4_ASTCA